MVGIAVASIGAGAAAATKLLTAETGRYTTGWQVKAGGPGEELRVWAPDFCRVALRLGRDIPYPAGYGAWRTWVLVAEEGLRHVTMNGPCGPDTQGGHVETTTGALRGVIAQSAFCAWVYDWRRAKLDGEPAAATRAAAVIAGAPRWPAVRAEDPHPNPADRGSLFGWLLPFRSAVRAGEVSRVGRLIASSYGIAGCPYFNPPAASQGGTVLPAPPAS